MNFWDFLLQLAQNPVFAGIAGGAGVSALLYQARAVPQAAWTAILRQSTVTMVLDNADELFEYAAIYFSQSDDVKRSRWLRMVNVYDDREQKWVWRASFGPGWHLLRDRGHWFLLNRHIEDKSAGLTLKRRETLTIRTFGRSQTPMRELMKRAEDVYEGGETVRVYLWHEGCYVMADRKLRRDPETLYLPAEQKTALFEDLHRWADAREWYAGHGIPYRRGYLLEGPPGTGKTSLALAMAGAVRRPLYLVNLATAGGDTGLQAAFNNAETGAVIVIEDIDSARISHQRDRGQDVAGKDVDPGKMVTLAGLLNAVDGVGSRDNRVLVMTSNRADVLDEALIRPGRVDRREHIGLLAAQEARAMCSAFLGEEAGARFFECEVRAALPMSPAKLQGDLIAACEDV